jgi:hypothetical protein
VSADKLDLVDYVSAIRSAFETARFSKVILRSLTAQHFNWKYRSNAGLAKLAVFCENGHITSSVAAIPLVFLTPRGLRLGWQIEDIFTAPKFRGRGRYRVCLTSLLSELESEPVICFPNANSVGRIRQEGFSLRVEISAAVRPSAITLIRTLRGTRRKSRREIESGEASIPVNLYSHSNWGIHKSADYLRWRYEQCPTVDYQCFRCPQAYAFGRRYSLFGVRVFVVTEFRAPTQSDAHELFRQIHSFVAAQGLRATFVFADRQHPSTLPEEYISVPDGLLPKRIHLYARTPFDQAKSQWDCQIGDWDGF